MPDIHIVIDCLVAGGEKGAPLMRQGISRAVRREHHDEIGAARQWGEQLGGMALAFDLRCLVRQGGRLGVLHAQIGPGADAVVEQAGREIAPHMIFRPPSGSAHWPRPAARYLLEIGHLPVWQAENFPRQTR